MKVLFGITTGVGASSYFRGLFAHLASNGTEVLFAAQDEAGARDFAYSENAEFFAIRAARNPRPSTDLRTLLQLLRILWTERPDVAVWGTPKVGLLGVVSSRLVGVKCVYVIHGLRYQGAYGWKRRILQLLEGSTIRLADHVISVGKEISESLSADGITRGRVPVIHRGSANGVVDPGEVDRDSARRRFGIEEPRFAVGFVGRVTGDKGVEVLLRAWSDFRERFPESVLFVAGNKESDSKLPPLSLLIEEAEGVEWLGHISDLSEFYSAMDVVVLPSKREGLPAVVLEAGAHGTPVIGSLCPGVSEAIVHGVTGLKVDCSEPRNLSHAMCSLYVDAEGRRRMGVNAKRFVLGNYLREDVHKAWGAYLSGISARRG